MNSLLAFLALLQLWPNPGPGRAAVAAAGGPVTQVFAAGSGTNLQTTAATRFSFPTAFGTQSTVESDVEAILLDGTISSFRARLPAGAGTGGDTVTLTLRRCNPTCADTLISCSIVNAATTCTDPDSFTVAAGDRITMQIVTANSPVSQFPYWTFKWVGTNNNEAMLVTAGIEDSPTGTECIDMSGRGLASIVCGAGDPAGRQAPAAANYTITGLYAKHSTTITAGCRQITLRPNNVNNTNFQVVLDGSTFKSDLSGTAVTYNTGDPGDQVWVEDDPGIACASVDPTPTTGTVAVTLRLETTTQEFQNTICESSSLGATVLYAHPSGSPLWSVTEANRDAETNGFTATGLTARFTGAPGSGGDTYTLSLRSGAADVTGMTCPIIDADLSCNVTGLTTAVANASMIGIRSLPSGPSPATPTAYCISWAGKGT